VSVCSMSGVRANAGSRVGGAGRLSGPFLQQGAQAKVTPANIGQSAPKGKRLLPITMYQTILAVDVEEGRGRAVQSTSSRPRPSSAPRSDHTSNSKWRNGGNRLRRSSARRRQCMSHSQPQCYVRISVTPSTSSNWFFGTGFSQVFTDSGPRGIGIHHAGAELEPEKGDSGVKR
jgi:hypothetical protein